MKVSGSHLAYQTLKKLGVTFATGSETGPLGDLFSLMKRDSSMTAIRPVSSMAGAFICYGNTFARLYPAVVLASTPADAANSVAGVGTAWADRVPVVVITASGQNGECSGLGRSGGIFSGFVKKSFSIDSFDLIPDLLAQAFREAISGCMGTVHVDVAESALQERREIGRGFDMVDRAIGTAPVPTVIEGDSGLIERALSMILAADRPFIISGGGVVHCRAWEGMDLLVRALGIPASTSMAGTGTIRADNPCFIGGPSYLGGEAFHRAIKRADCVLVIGAALSGLEGFGRPPVWNRDISFIQVDIDPINICLNTPSALPILGDAGAVIRRMLEIVNDRYSEPNPKHVNWLNHLLAVKKKWRRRIEGEADASWPVMHQGYLARMVHALSDPETFFVIDGGNTALWAGMFCMPHAPQSAIFPAGLGTLGSGIPIAIGIQSEFRDRPVVVLQGDGSFLYNVRELETAKRLGVNFIVVIFNDKSWNMIKVAQDFMFGGRNVGTLLGDIDYASIARGFGCYGRRVDKADELKEAFREAGESGAPAVLDVKVDPDNFPEPLLSFARVENEGLQVNPLRAIGFPKFRFDRRILNRLRYLINIYADLNI